MTAKDCGIPKDPGKSLLQLNIKRAGYGAGKAKGMLFLLGSHCLRPPNTTERVKGVFPSQGSVDDDISLGAYVAAALLELGQPLKVSLLLLPSALLCSPTPGHCYGDAPVRNAGVL